MLDGKSLSLDIALIEAGSVAFRDGDLVKPISIIHRFLKWLLISNNLFMREDRHVLLWQG